MTARGNTQLAWFDRTGKQIGIAGPTGEYGSPDLSPDGKFVAFARGTPPDIWYLDIEKNLASRLTSNAAQEFNAVWSPDGKTIAFDSTRDGGRNLYERAGDVVGEDRLVLKNEIPKNLSDWSRDGRYLAYAAGNDIAVPLSGDRKPLRVTATPFNKQAVRISPDGHWIAYASNESGSRPEVYLQSFTQPGSKKQVSTAGGQAPALEARWQGTVLYRAGFQADGRPGQAVKPADASLQIGAPVSLFQMRVPNPGRRNYNPSADGRFLINETATDQTATPITVILNWAAGRNK